jgi:ribosome-binding protein aMBF1 (putative translation factor)
MYICIYIYITTEKLELAQSVSATITAHHETAGMSQEGLEAAKKEMERSVSSINSQLGIKEAEISRLMAVTLELNDRASRAEQVDRVMNTCSLNVCMIRCIDVHIYPLSI